MGIGNRARHMREEASLPRSLSLLEATMIGIGAIPPRVSLHSPASVMPVKGYDGPLKKWFKRTFR